MNRRQDFQTDTIRKSITLLGKILRDHPEFRDVAANRDKLIAHAARIEEARDRQALASKVRTGASAAIKKQVVDLRTIHLLRIAHKAKPLFRHDAAVSSAVRICPTRATPDEHADCAMALAKALRPHLPFCISEGFEKDFLKEMVNDAKALRKAATKTDTALRERSRATSDLRRAIRDAREEVKITGSLLKAHARRQASGTGPLRGRIDEWLGVSSVGKKVGRPRKSKRPPPRRPSQPPE